MTNWRFHDIRRTVATKMRGLEIDRLTVSKVLNHAESGITRIYDRYSENKEKKQALERWGVELTRIIEGKHNYGEGGGVQIASH